MALGSIQKAYNVFTRHDFSRSHQLRILDVGVGVPSYVRDELINQEGRVYATSYSVPGRAVTEIKVPFQGFDFHWPGQVSYPDNPWKISFKTPGDFLVRNALERWSFETANDSTSCGKLSVPCETSTFDIAVLSNSCEIIRVYRLFGVFITTLSEISYNQETVEGTKFDAGFYYQYWRPAGGYDTGSVDSTRGSDDEVNGVYSTFAGNIRQGVQSCPTGVPGV